mgnify:FL=1
MANETLKWRLLLQDSVSPGAKSARDSLKAFRGELARVGRDQARAASQNARRMQENQRLLAAGTRQGLGLLGGLAIGAVGALAGIVEAFGGMGLAAARGVIEIAAFRESSLAALETVMGSSDAAGRSFRNAMVMANQTPADTADVVANFQRFAVAGFAEREIAPLVAATADIGAAFGTTASDSFALVTSQMRAAGKMDRGDLRQLLNAGVNTGEVLDSIARQMNIQGATEQTRRAAVLEAISRRQVTGEVGIQAALDATRNRLDRGGNLGTFARRQSETLVGALSNAKNAVFNMIAGMDFANIPGVQTFKNTLLAITAALADGTPAAAMLRGAVAGAANAVGGLFGRIFTVQNAMGALQLAGRAFGAIGRFATMAWPVVRAFVGALGPGFMAGIAPLRAMLGSLLTGGPPSARTLALITGAARGLGSAIGFAAGAITTFLGGVGLLATGLAAAWGTIGGLVAAGITSVRAMFTPVGTGIVDGIIAGITGGIGRMGESIRGLGASAVQSARAALGIHSPSRVFADAIGRQIPAGIELGISQGSGGVNDAVAGLGSPGAMRLGGGGVSFGDINISVMGGNTNAETATNLRDAVRAELEVIFGRMAEAGA